MSAASKNPVQDSPQFRSGKPGPTFEWKTGFVDHLGTLWRLRMRDAGCVRGGKAKGKGHD
jgi:hypothetical protein